ncbi:MFS transporter [Deinococcus sp.]|uniref:MFS transporter n=1 Tax=Deinococcus sp. TaxID=47478 RepID=UPI003B5AAF5D
MISSNRPRSPVWALAVLATAGYGALYYAQPLLAVATEQQTGWSRSQTSLALTLALLTNAALAPVAGRALDQFGGHSLLSVGGLLGALSLLGLSLNPDSIGYGGFLLCWLLAGVAMTLTFYEAVFTVLAQQVCAAARLRATLTVTLVAGLASSIFVPLTTGLLHWGGLPLALRVLAAVLLGAALLCWVSLPLDTGNKSLAFRPVHASFAPDPAFTRLSLSLTLARIVSAGVGLQLAPLLLSRGEAPALAAGLAGLMGLAALPGRILFGPLLARLGVQRLTGLLLLGLGTGPLVLALTGRPGAAAVGIILFGLTNGALTLARSELLLNRYPPALFGTVNGHLALPVNLAQALTPFGMGLLFSWTRGYTISLVLLSVLAGLAAWLMLTQNNWAGRSGGDAINGGD